MEDRHVEIPWLEWVAFVIAAVVVFKTHRRGRVAILFAIVALAGAWICGTAGGLLFPAIFGMVCYLVQGFCKRWQMAGRFLALCGILASAALCWLFPVPVSPELAGPYAIGTETFEIHCDDPERPLVAQVWYPAKEDTSKPFAPWLPSLELTPKLPYHRIRYAKSRARVGPEPVSSIPKFPVIFYEHSWTGHRAENEAQVEQLASRGFVVVAIDHPGQAERVKYADGRVILGKLPAILDLTTDAGVSDFETLAEKCITERIGDLHLVKAALTNGGASQLAGRLLLDRVGIVGYSFGGTCALRICAEDPAFYAGANEDGFFLGKRMPAGPFLFFDEEMPAFLLKDASPDEGPGDALTRRSEIKIREALLAADRPRVILDGTRHPSFSDRILMCRIPQIARAGKESAPEVIRIVTTHLSDFFQQHLDFPHSPARE
jgi:dienelactone hydrolase